MLAIKMRWVARNSYNSIIILKKVRLNRDLGRIQTKKPVIARKII